MNIFTLSGKKRSFLALFVTAMLTFSSSVNAQTWNLAEPTDGSGATGTDVGRGICTDASGNVYIVGVFNGTGDFNLNSAATSNYTSVGNDGFVASYDKNGAFRWQTIISGTGSDFIAPSGGICTDGTSVWFTGNVNMTGAPQVISGTNTVTITSTGGAGADVVVGKLACSNGAVNWAVEFGGAGSNDGGEGICVDPSGCCYVVGSYGGTFTLNGHTAAASGGTSDLFVAKFNPGGGLLRVSTGGSSTAADMISNGAGICYVPGGTPAIVAGGSCGNGGTITYGGFSTASSGSIDAVLLEMDTTLNFTNALVLGTATAATDEILGVAYDPFSGGVYVSGYYNGGTITLPGTAAMTNSGVQDIMVARYSVAANNFTWAAHAGGTGDDRGESITADGQGGILVSGNTGSIPCTFGGSVSISSSSAGLNDLYVAHYNTSGTPIWASVAGEATGDDQARGVASYVQSAPYVQNVFTTGNFQNSATFGVTTLVADGGSDYFLARINDLSTPLSATQSQVNLTCNGVCTGSATVVASGGTAPYTYSWSPSGGSGATASSLCATNYTVTVTDAASSSITKTYSITQPPAITSSVVSQTNVACNGGTTGAATITASGGTGTLTYNWNPGNPTGDGTVSVTGLSALTWTCTVTDANSCTKTQTVTITQPPALVATPVSQTNISCNGGTNGSATVSASGGTPGYTYSWSPSGGTGATASGLAANTYTVTVTDANSCTATRTFTITAPPAIATTAASQTNVSCFGGSNGAATISVSGGTPGYTYDWTPGTPTGDGTASVTGLTAQTWTCTVTDANGCTATRPFTITAPPAIATTAASQTNVSCFGGSNGAATVSVSGGTPGYTYDWTPGTPTGDGTASVTGLTAQTWTCTVTDANGCTATRNFTITAPPAIATTAASQTNVSCFGGSNGAATISVSGGTPGYTYDWTPGTPTGDGTASVTGLTAQTWTCTVTDANGCTATRNFTITAPPAIATTAASQTNVSCFGGSNGAATISVSGGTPGYTYDWTPGTPTGDGTASVTGLTAQTWTCTVTDANGCTATRPFTITAPPAITTTAVSQTNVSCNGGTNGSATVSASGGTPGYTYSWAPSGGTAATASGLSANTYTVTVTDANGCTATRPFTITSPSAIVTTAVSQTNVSCNGGTNGSATVSASGGTPGYTYSWAPSGGTAATASGLSANTYTVTVTDANGCTATRPFTITAPPAITTTAVSQTNVSCNGGINGSATVSASGGTPGYTYSWAPSGGTAATASGLSANTYTVTVTDANGCTATRPFTITAPPAITTTAVSQTNVSCNAGTNGSATVSASGGTPGYTYSWAPSGGTAATASGLAANTYTVTVTDANGCTATRPFTITAPSAITATISSTTTACSSNTGTATVVASGGTPGYTYSWAPSGGTAATASALGAGSYTCTITDANGCVITKTTSVTTPSGPTLTVASQTNVSCNAGSNGTASVNAATGGTGPYTYNWTPGNPTGDGTVSVTGLTAGTWTCTVTDANGCTSLATFTLTAPSAIVTTAVSQTNVSCNGGTNGSATVSASGGTPGYTYSWSPSGGTAATASGLSANTYTVTITDANGCTATRPFTITAPSAIVTAAVSQTNVSCNGGTNGSATVSASGGTPGYTYSWSPSGGTAATASGLAANTYTVTVTDANGCTATRPFTITAPSAITSSIVSQTNVSCHGGTTGAATITASGGTGSYTYNWTPGNPTGDGTVSVTGLTAGVWTCTITDANGCTKTQIVTITEPTTLTATSTFTNVTCFGSCNGTATVTASGGTAPYTYSWTPSGGTGATASSLCAGTYTCTITDSHGCTATPTVTITQPLALSATATFTGVTCFGLCNGTATVTASGGTGPYTYSWSPSGGIGATATSLCAGTYACTITDSHGCTATQTVTINQPLALSATATFTNVTCFGSCNGTATVTASGGTGPYAYSWSPSGGTGATATGLCAGTYTCTITDSHGCTGTQTVTITEPAALSATATFTNVTCFGSCNGTATVTASGGTGPYTYSWSPSGGTGATATGLCAGTYVCTITDANGCTTTETVTITEPAVLSATATFTNVTCFGSCNGTASITASGGTAPYTYSWLPSGGTTATATGLCAGTYTCTITDANGCTTTQTITITQPAAITGSQTLTVCAGVSVTVGTSTYNTTGTYTDVLTAFNTCDSTVTTNLTVLPANTTSQILTVCAGVSVTVGTSTYNTTGTFTDVLIAFNTCDSTVTTNLTVLPANTTSQTLMVCAGGSVTVGTNTYNTSGTYTDVLTGFNACDSTVTTILTVNAPIDVTTSVAGNVITANSSTGTYQWLDCNSAMAPIAGETNQSFTALSNGDFAVQVTDNGCVDTSACVNITGSGLSTSLSGETWNVYPNPTSGTFNLVITNTSFKELVISITDIQGKEIYNYDDKNISANYNKQISLENLAKGIYYLKLNTGSQIVIKKLIVN